MRQNLFYNGPSECIKNFSITHLVFGLISFKFYSLSVSNNVDMANCLFLYHGVLRYEVANSIIFQSFSNYLCLHLRKLIFCFLLRNLEFGASYFENDLAEFRDIHTVRNCRLLSERIFSSI